MLALPGLAFIAVELLAAPQEPAPAVQVTIVVDPSGEATIHERYRVPRDTSRIVLGLLDRPCTTIRHVTLWNYHDTVALAVARTGPWQIFQDSTGAAYNVDSAGFELTYVTTVPGAGDIPIVHLAHPIPRREGEREGPVALAVSFRGDARGVVPFPPLTHLAGGAYTGRFAAVPAFVHVELADAEAARAPDCAEVNRGAVSDGGLAWRFWLLVGIMVVWVPLYLAWARRTRDDDA